MDPSPEPAPDLSVVIPAHNEEAVLAGCLEELAAHLRGAQRGTFETIVVDDGSTDRTWRVLCRLKDHMPGLVCLRFRTNAGQTAALDAGFRAARGAVVITMDADMQNDPADIPKLLDALRDSDVVCGIRQRRRDSPVRRFSSRVANAVRNILTGDDIQDVGCSLRAMRAEALKGLKLYRGMHRFLPTLLKLDGWSVAQIPVNHRARERGRSKYGIRNRIFCGLRDVFAVRWMKSRWLRYEVVESEH